VDAVAEAVDGDLDLDVRLSWSHRSRYSESSPNAARASDRQIGSTAASSRGERTMRMPLAPAARRRLDEDRVADALRLLEGLGLVEQQAGAGDRRQAVRREQPAGLLLRGEPLEDVRRRADERQVVGPHRVGERVVLDRKP
jgi:hypothetical protein